MPRTGNISMRMDDARDRWEDSGRKTAACIRNVQDGKIADIREYYDELKVLQEKQALYHCASILGSLCKIVGAGFPEKDGVGRAIAGIGSTCDSLGQFKINFDQSSIRHLEGLLDQTRTYMQNTGKEDDELRQLILQIERMLDDAKAKADRSVSAPFTSSSG